MTNYKIVNHIVNFTIANADTGEMIPGGPYKNEESAKRRIRDLKRRDAENAAEREQTITTVAASISMSEISTNVAVGNEFPNTEIVAYDPPWATGFNPTPRPSHYVSPANTTNTVKPTELGEHKPAYGTPACDLTIDTGYDPADADLYNPANIITATRQISINHSEIVAFLARPTGVYPAVAKKFYRQQWK